MGRKARTKWTRRVAGIRALLASKWATDREEGARRHRLFRTRRAYQQAAARNEAA